MMKPGSKQWKNFMKYLYGYGAAVVIFGALFKIMHWPGASLMLIIGLTTEAIIFIFSSMEPLHEEVDWSLVYPELSGMHGDGHGEGHEHLEEHPTEEKEEDKGTITEQLDTMLAEAKIGPELIESLGQGLRSLSENATKLGDVTEATVATSDFTNNMRSASKSVENLSSTYDQARSAIASSTESLAGSYSKASSALDMFSSTNSESFQQAQTYGEQLTKVAKNLAALNASYELQLQGSQDHLGATTKLYAGIEDLMQQLNQSIEDTRKYKSEIENLSTNLAALNTVYGNMLTALNYKK